MTTTRAELQAQMEEFQKYGESKLSKPAGSGPKGKTTKKQDVEHRRAVKGIQDEKDLGKWVEGFLPDVEKEEARVSRARKRVLDTMRILQQAELRTTRTRRSTKKIDYTYDSLEEVRVVVSGLVLIFRRTMLRAAEDGEGLQQSQSHRAVPSSPENAVPDVCKRRRRTSMMTL